jgi:hypothetical protein
MTRRSIPVAISAVLLLAAAGCEVQKSENPLSPSIAGPIAGVQITAPRLLLPQTSVRVKESQQPITLLVENSSTNGVRPISYSFEVASDSAFATVVFSRSRVQPGPEGRTTVTLDTLPGGQSYHWRVRAEDGANSSEYAASSFEILPKPQLDPPPQHAPVNNAQVASARPELVVGMSTRNAAIGNVTYTFQIAADVAFSAIVAVGTRSEAGATTIFTTDGPLAPNTTFFWRVRASDEEFTGAWSATQSFRTPAAAPSPGPAPGPSNPGAPCNSSDPQVIVSCERSKYGHMNDGQIVSFLVSLADSLNRNGIPGGRFGLLLKPSGNNCRGYSCDIICSGNGGGQRQWDVLGDVEGAQSPSWAELPASHITVRPCEIR